jgi:hypothetical protein
MIYKLEDSDSDSDVDELWWLNPKKHKKNDYSECYLLLIYIEIDTEIKRYLRYSNDEKKYRFGKTFLIRCLPILNKIFKKLLDNIKILYKDNPRYVECICKDADKYINMFNHFMKYYLIELPKKKRTCLNGIKYINECVDYINKQC